MNVLLDNSILSIIIRSVVIGVIVALVVVSVMRGKLKTVKRQNYASDYRIAGSFRLTKQADFFLYSTVTKIAKPKNNPPSNRPSGPPRRF